MRLTKEPPMDFDFGVQIASPAESSESAEDDVDWDVKKIETPRAAMSQQKEAKKTRGYETAHSTSQLPPL